MIQSKRNVEAYCRGLGEGTPVRPLGPAALRKDQEGGATL